MAAFAGSTMRRPLSQSFEQDEHLPPTKPTAGYVLSTFHPPPSSFLSAYSSLMSALSSAFADDLAKVHIYPPSALHVTIATLHPFTSPPPSSPETLKSNLDTVDFPSLPFSLKAQTLNVGSKAVIVRFLDSSRMMSRLRTSVSKASYPESHAPDIVHMTVARFTQSFKMPNLQKVRRSVYGARQQRH